MPFDKTDPRPLDWKLSEAFRDVEKLEAASKEADEKLCAARMAADAYALAYIAACECPADIKQFGRNHGIPMFAEMSWQAGFVAGWRMARAEPPQEDAAAMEKNLNGRSDPV